MVQVGELEPGTADGRAQGRAASHQTLGAQAHCGLRRRPGLLRDVEPCNPRNVFARGQSNARGGTFIWMPVIPSPLSRASGPPQTLFFLRKLGVTCFQPVLCWPLFAGASSRMRRRFAVCLAAAFAGCASDSSTDTSTLAAACHAFDTAACTRLYACYPTMSGTVASCVSKADTLNACAEAACPPGTSFDSPQAGLCLDGLEGQSCTDVQDSVVPVACETVCQ